jgi:hypothetical protein
MFTLHPELLVEFLEKKTIGSIRLSCLYFGVHGIVQIGPLVYIQHQII